MNMKMENEKNWLRILFDENMLSSDQKEAHH